VHRHRLQLHDPAGVHPASPSVPIGTPIGNTTAYVLDGRGEPVHFVSERLAVQHWETPRLLEAMWAAPDFYFDAMAQIRLDRWSLGRAVLLGDAGYCASPMSGQGTSVALVGAYVLADALARAGGEHGVAFPAYEGRLRQFVRVNQAWPRSGSARPRRSRPSTGPSSRSRWTADGQPSVRV
jgi:2-polyprenyl-6-methoxyphenol hydroxylase-like FAD-dependent oxidoreductase